MKFPYLSADDVDARVSTVNEKGVSLLLYKDARCDMRILDETIGAENWQREHYECKGNLFCRVGIKTADNGWVWKADCGTESYTEKEKGEASDSFKRACFNWGIGRELYTAPFIWVKAENCNIKPGNNGKPTCTDKFKVKHMTVENGKITALYIDNASKRAMAYTFGEVFGGESDMVDANTVKAIKMLIQKKGWNVEAAKDYIRQKWDRGDLNELLSMEAGELMYMLNQKPDKA